MRYAFLALLALLQQDPFAVLASSAKRSIDADRKAAAERLRSIEKDGAHLWVAARFLERSERDWRLRQDRLTTREGVFAGRAEGGTFYAFSGKRLDAAAGRLEKDVADPLVAELDPILAKYYAGVGLGEEAHAAALEALVAAQERTRGRSEALEVLRLLGAAHLGAVGEKGAGAAAALGYSRAEGRWGTPEQLRHFRVAASWSSVDGRAEAAARSAPAFGSRYAGALARVHRAFAEGSGFEAAHRALAELSEPGFGEHLKALASSLKGAVFCKDCKSGKVACAGCKGKGRRDVDCPTCEGKGRVRPTGAIGNTDLSVKCRNCDGLKVFRNAGCTDCARSGVANCASCLGRPWRDRPCANAACKDGMVACASCKGDTTPLADCPVCAGKGRNRASGAVGDADVTVKCRGCEGRGKVEGQCAPCSRTGRVRCGDCKSKTGAAKSGAVADVFATEPCRDCSGAGWPLAGVAMACPRCLGLGVKVKPASDPTKTLN